MDRKIGEIIGPRAGLDEATLARAALSATRNDQYIGEYLIETGQTTEAVVYQALAEQFGMRLMPEIDVHGLEKLVREFPAELFKDGGCLPIGRDDDCVRLAVCDPLDLGLVMDVEASAGSPVLTVLTLPSELRRCRNLLFGASSPLTESAGLLSRELEKNLTVDEKNLSLEDIKKSTESEPVVKMVSLLFDEAIRLRASDIHIEPAEDHAAVRFRIDGMLRQHTDISRTLFLPLTSRIKILADLDIAEKRIPQDGRIRHESGGAQYDFRISTLPTHFGEKTVVRILKHDMKLLSLANLGLKDPEYSLLRELIEKPQGILFVTGPTGSGKSSTLFACLNMIRGKAINITTIENPIEYKLEGINQVQVNEKAGVTFASALRSILRQDPDVILIGEIRDSETAQIAIQASQTGHLVFSTLHTNDAISAVTRLRDLGIPGFLISSSLIGILAQRLVRIVCPYCRQEGHVSDETKKRWETLFGTPVPPRSWSARGCAQCGGTGYLGRTGIYELIPVDEHLRGMFADNAPETRVRQYVRSAGIRSLIQNGVRAIENGDTTPEELLRVVLVEDILQIHAET